MAYTQKNNPFKKTNKSERSPLFTHINASPTEGHPASEHREGIRRLNLNRQKAAEIVKNTRTELGDTTSYVDDKGVTRYRTSDNTRRTNQAFIKTANIKGEDGVKIIDKIMLKGPEFVESFRQEVLKTAEPFLGLDKEQLNDTTYMLGAVYDLDLSNFKPYLEKTNVTVNDIKKIIKKQISNMPDEDGNGKPDAFDFWGSEKILNTLIDRKLKALES